MYESSENGEARTHRQKSRGQHATHDTRIRTSACAHHSRYTERCLGWGSACLMRAPSTPLSLPTPPPHVDQRPYSGPSPPGRVHEYAVHAACAVRAVSYRALSPAPTHVPSWPRKQPRYPSRPPPPPNYARARAAVDLVNAAADKATKVPWEAAAPQPRAV